MVSEVTLQTSSVDKGPEEERAQKEAEPARRFGGGDAEQRGILTPSSRTQTHKFPLRLFSRHLLCSYQQREERVKGERDTFRL